MVRIFFLPYFGNLSKSDPCSYELFCLESHILSFPKILQIPRESPCRMETSWNPNSNTLELDQPQYDRPAVCVITQKNSFTMKTSLSFLSCKDKLGGISKILFRCRHFLSICLSLKLRNLKFSWVGQGVSNMKAYVHRFCFVTLCLKMLLFRNSEIFCSKKESFRFVRNEVCPYTWTFQILALTIQNNVIKIEVNATRQCCMHE